MGASPWQALGSGTLTHLPAAGTRVLEHRSCRWTGPQLARGAREPPDGLLGTQGGPTAFLAIPGEAAAVCPGPFHDKAQG